MKSNTLTLFFLLITTTIAFSEEVVTIKKNIGEFTEIYIEEGVTIKLIHSDSPEVTIVGEESAVKKVDVFNSNNVLKIKPNEILSANLRPKVVVKYNEVSKITINGNCNIEQDGELKFNKLSLVINGKCKTTLKLKVNTSLGCRIDEAEVELIGSAGIFNGNISNGAFLNLDLDADKIRCTIEEETSAKLSGSTDLLFANVSGGGEIDAYALQSEKVKVSIFGESTAEVTALRELHVIADGKCKVYYKGGPRMVKSEKSGGAEVIKATE